MSQRRMFSLKVIDTDLFLEMPPTSRLLYYELSMRADDDGFVASPRKILKMVGCSEDDFKILMAKQYIIPFESGVCVIRHWRVHNLIRNDRYNETEYKEEKAMLTEQNSKYELCTQSVIPNGNQMEPQVRLGKVRLGKVRLGYYGWIELTEEQHQKLVEEYGQSKIDKQIELLDEYIQSNNNKNKYKDWNLVLRKSIRDNWFSKQTPQKQNTMDVLKELYDEMGDTQ